MSGGSHNYIYSKIEDELVGRMHDRELDDLMQDIADLAHDLEWADSGDYSPEGYKKSVEKFKLKWFSMPRVERLRHYIENRLAAIQSELFALIEPTDKKIIKEDEAEKAPQVSMFARAVITAYTGITMLQGDQLDYYYQYLNHLFGRPVYTHEIPRLDAEIKKRSKPDFIRLCAEPANDNIQDSF